MCLESLSFLSCLTCKGFEKIGSTATSINDRVAPFRLHLTRIGYWYFLFFYFSLFLLFGFFLALFLRGNYFDLLKHVPVLYDGCKLADQQFNSACFGKNSVYRICFSLVLFYFFNAILSSRIFCVGDKIR